MSSVPAGLSGCMKTSTSKLLRFGPKRIKVFALVVTMVHVGGDIGAAKSKLGDRVLQYFRGALGLLNRHCGHGRKAVGIFF